MRDLLLKKRIFFITSECCSDEVYLFTRSLRKRKSEESGKASDEIGVTEMCVFCKEQHSATELVG